MKRIVGRVPVRLDLAGGTLDIWPIYLTLPSPAVTVNVAVGLLATARVEPLERGRVRLESLDRGERVEYASMSALGDALASGGGACRLLARAALAVAPEGGFSLTTGAASPAGAGLGGSSALLACVVATLARAADRPMPLESVRRMAQDLETWVIDGPTGYQDYYPPLFGGCLALEGRPGGVEVEKLDVDLRALESRLRLVYTGAPRLSGITNWGALKAYFDGEPKTRGAIHEIAHVAHSLREALRRGRLDRALELVVEEGAIRRRMAPGIVTPEIEALDLAARSAGALGTKVMGAGGGGCVLVVLGGGAPPPGLDPALIAGGGTVLPCRLVPDGLSFDDNPPR